MPKIWMRVGAELELTNEQALQLQENPSSELIAEIIKKNGLTTNGETYCPHGCGVWGDAEVDFSLSPITLRT